MEGIYTLRQLLTWYLQGLLETEKALLSSFPPGEYSETSDRLKEIIARSEFLSAQHITELQPILQGISEPYDFTRVSFAIDGISLDFYELMGRIKDIETTDAAIIVYLKTMCHYKMTGYDMIASYARFLHDEHLAAKMQDLFIDEKHFDETLTKLIESRGKVHVYSHQMRPPGEST